MNDGNETINAVSLQYDGIDAPRVTAKGEADLAEQILKIAHEHGIPIHKDKALTRMLSQVDIGAEIPPLLYVAVAEVLAFTYRLQDLAWVEPESPPSE